MNDPLLRALIDEMMLLKERIRSLECTTLRLQFRMTELFGGWLREGEESPRTVTQEEIDKVIAFRRDVLSRDNFTCQDCDSFRPNLDLHVHHLLTVRHHPEAKYDVDNGVTLCDLCHYARHKGINHHTHPKFDPNRPVLKL